METALFILLRTFLGYVLLIFLMRFMGKREIGQISLFDLLILLSIADIMVIGIENFNENYLYCVLPMLLIAGIQKLIAFLSLRFPKMRKIMDGKETVLIHENKMNLKEMKKQNYNLDDFLQQLRGKEIGCFSEVEVAILETSGKLSVFKKKEKKKTIGVPFYLSGIYDEKILQFSSLTKDSFRSFLKNKTGYTEKQIISAFYLQNEIELVDKDGNIVLVSLK